MSAEENNQTLGVPEQKRQNRETAKKLLVDLMLAIRADYLANGANPLEHWNQLESRLKLASRVTSNTDQWYSTMLRHLNIPSASSSVCFRYELFRNFLIAHEMESIFIGQLSGIVPAVMALARNLAVDKKAEKDARKKELAQEIRQLETAGAKP